jgi:Helix-turn-helix domain
MEHPAQVRDARRVFHFWLDDAVLDHFAKDLGPHAFMVYAYIARRSKAGQAFPGMRRIARDLGLGYSTIQRSITQMQHLGLISVTPRPSALGDADSNLYTLLDLSHLSSRGAPTENAPAPTENAPAFTPEAPVHSLEVQGAFPPGTEVEESLSSRVPEVGKEAPPSLATLAPPPEGEACAARGKTIRRFRNGQQIGHKTKAFPMPGEPLAQEALLESLLNPAFHTWYVNNAITRPLLAGWDDFVLDCLAHGRCYVSFADAFKNYLKNGYEPAPKHASKNALPARRHNQLAQWAAHGEGSAHDA